MEIKDFIYDMLMDKTVALELKHRLVDAMQGEYASIDTLKTLMYRPAQVNANNDEMGCYGGIWVRKLFFPTLEAHNKGHSHDFDHVTLLASGSLRVEVNGELSQLFTSPTFIIIRKGVVHNLIPQEPNTLAFCTSATRNSMKGESPEELEFFDSTNDPMIVDIKD